MLSSPLQLNGYFLTELNYVLLNDFKSPPVGTIKYDNLELQLEADTKQYTEDPLEWRCQLLVASKDTVNKRHPYHFRVVYVGFFTISADYPKDRVELLAKTNAPALLYSAIRETLISLTSRGPVPPLLLPSVTFLDKAPQEDKSATRKQSRRKLTK